MKQRHLFSIVFLALWAVACMRPPASDQERYLAERRAAGMSEEAEGALRLIANVLAGGNVVTYERQADGLYLVSYSNAFCVRPGTDARQVEALRAKSRVAAAAQLEKLKTLADTDHSGFVSTAEGVRVHQLVSFAWEATFVAEHEPDRNFGHLAQAMGMPPDLFQKRLLGYRELLHRSADLGLPFKDVPVAAVR